MDILEQPFSIKSYPLALIGSPCRLRAHGKDLRILPIILCSNQDLFMCAPAVSVECAHLQSVFSKSHLHPFPVGIDDYREGRLCPGIPFRIHIPSVDMG